MAGALTIAGIGLITAAIVPTPDDITVISPLLQLAVGAGMIWYDNR